MARGRMVPSGRAVVDCPRNDTEELVKPIVPALPPAASRRRGLRTLGAGAAALLAACAPLAATPTPAAPPRSDESAASSAAHDLSRAFRDAAGEAMPAVVSIVVDRGPRDASEIPDLFRFFFERPGEEPRDPNAPEAPGREEPSDLPPDVGSASGFVLDSAGHVVTNDHVVEGAIGIRVLLRDGREFPAEVVGRDEATDVAVLRIRAEDLPVAELGDSDDVQVGDWVLALGSPLGLDFTVTAGIVSAKGRRLTTREGSLEAFLQTDAAINPGNSGGPLVDLSGRVVGINTAISGGPVFIGYGFAIPMELARRVIGDLIEHGAVRRPKLGVQISDVTAVDAEAYGLETVTGADVNVVEPGGPAARAGIRLGDVIVAVDDHPVEDATDLTAYLARYEPGDTVEVTVLRGERRRTIDVQLGVFEVTREPQTEPVARAGPAERALGFRMEELDAELAGRFGWPAEERGVIVTDVGRFAPAALAGLRPGQKVVSVDGEPVEGSADLERIASDVEPGEVVSLHVRAPDEAETLINYRVDSDRASR